MVSPDVRGQGTEQDPWILRDPPGKSEYTAYRDERADPPALVCQVGRRTISYHLRCLDDLHAMLKAHGDWMPLGSSHQQQGVKDGTVEAWARSLDNPVGGWYGLTEGFRGRFAHYVPPVLAQLGLAELERIGRHHRMRAV